MNSEREAAAMVGVRLDATLLARVDAWLARQREGNLTRAQAVRHLLEHGLAAEAL